MPCSRPITGWRLPDTKVRIGPRQPVPGSQQLHLPCGRCTLCIKARAQAWALRCTLELQQHEGAAFTTLTYNEKNCPITLEKRHIQLWLKRLRYAIGKHHSGRPIRYFLSGEYGPKRNRPHYHAILYGLTVEDADLIETQWGLGHARTKRITPGSIAYVAGYTSKKWNDKHATKHERVDPNTGELYTWQPPFIEMSQGLAKTSQQYTASWRSFAVLNGQPMPVPRYLHEAWKKQATQEQLDQLTKEKNEIILTRHRTPEQNEAQDMIDQTLQRIATQKRNLE